MARVLDSLSLMPGPSGQGIAHAVVEVRFARQPQTKRRLGGSSSEPCLF